MKTERHESFLRHTCSLIVILIVLCFAALEAFALSPSSLVVVYNLNMPESKAVATHYAEKREMPLSQLVGVDVSTSEEMLRLDLEKKLIPPVLAAAQRLTDEGRHPAILLVYGIPLKVKDPVNIKPEERFVALAEGKLREYKALVLQMIAELDLLIDEKSISTPQPQPTQKQYTVTKVLQRARPSLERALQYLKTPQAGTGNKDHSLRVASLLIRLAGASPAARAFISSMSTEDKEHQGRVQNQELIRWNAILKNDLLERSFRGIPPETALETATAVRFVDGITGELQFWDKAKRMYEKVETAASVDSELTLMMVSGPYQHARWLSNPFHAGHDKLPFIEKVRQKTLMVGRLDGPTPEAAKRLVDDAVATEKTGLQGVFYIDARGLTDDKPAFGHYAWYDKHLVNLYEFLKDKTTMKLVIDTNPELFPVGACPDAALYCGWYSLTNYIDSFTWKRGAVGYHVASGEAGTLRNAQSNAWCRRMIEKGVAATLGPVDEPYLTSFPLPDHFFPLLMSGKLPLLEVYFRTTPFISWRQVVIGDPLYTPFKKNPAIRLPDKGAEKPVDKKMKGQDG